MTKRTTAPGIRLGTQMRGRLSKTYERPGNSKANLTLHYSFKARRDVALFGELQLLHFLNAETDPEVASISYDTATVVRNRVGEKYSDLIHAIATMKDGTTVWRRVIAKDPDDVETAAQLASLVREGTLSEVTRVDVWPRDRLVANPVRLRSALEIMAWIAAARDWPLTEQKIQLLSTIRKRQMTFEEVLALGVERKAALYGAAVLELACKGLIRHDLFESHLTAFTKFFTVRN